jgi:hypothetical protein
VFAAAVDALRRQAEARGRGLSFEVFRRYDLETDGRAKLELIAEAFNLLNSTNISSRRDAYYNFTNGVLVPLRGQTNPRLDFGADVGTQVNFSDTHRIVQLAAKITF